jgi:hypothetical protein
MRFASVVRRDSVFTQLREWMLVQTFDAAILPRRTRGRILAPFITQ